MTCPLLYLIYIFYLEICFSALAFTLDDNSYKLYLKSLCWQSLDLSCSNIPIQHQHGKKFCIRIQFHTSILLYILDFIQSYFFLFILKIHHGCYEILYILVFRVNFTLSIIPWLLNHKYFGGAFGGGLGLGTMQDKFSFLMIPTTSLLTFNMHGDLGGGLLFAVSSLA